MSYQGYDPLWRSDSGSTIRQCRSCKGADNDGLYDGDNFDKCPYCAARSLGLKSVGNLFAAAKFCDKARINNCEITRGEKYKAGWEL